jgi:serine/threonine-protein kinase
VYLARDGEGHAVALKVLDAALGAEPRYRERFLRESATAELLEHPSIVRVLDAGEDGGRLYLAMEWVDGPDLRALLREHGPLDPERAVALVEDVAGGLDVAHAAGLIHRDVKPANILVMGEHARLCDFGLAKHTARAESVTGERMLVGTVAYVAPEQIEGAGVDARADVYSLGCVLYECLTGEPPFDRDSELAMLYAHLNEPPPRPSARRDGVPPALDDVVAAALAKSPDARPQSCGELARDARAALRGERPRSRARRGVPVLAGAVGGVAVVAVAAALLASGGDPPRAAPPLAVGADVLAAVDARSGRLVSRVRLPAKPDDVVVGGNSVWVLLDGARRVARVDAGTRKVTATVALPFPPGGLAADGDDLWVAEAAGPRVARLAAAGGVDRPLRVRRGAEHAGPVTVGFGSLWLGRGPEVLRVDPRSGRVLARLSTPVDVTEVQAGDDAVYAVSAGEGRIAKIDAATSRVVARNRLHGWVSDLAVGGGSVWLGVVPDDVVFRLSADDLAVAGTSRTGSGPDVLSWDAGRLWASSGDGRSLIRSGGEGGPARVRLDAIPVSVAAGRGLLWTATLPLPPPARAPGKGGELRIAMQDQALSIDPAALVSPDLAQLRYTTCARLMTYPDAAGAAGRRLVPEVASVPPSVSPDRRTYTFRIRPGFRFSPPSNEPVTAEMFRATIERALSPRLGEGAPAMFVAGDIVGAAAYHAGRARHVSGLEVRGDQLIVRLERPAGDLPARLAMPFFCPVAPGTPATPNGLRAPLASAGPYYIATEAPGRVTLERNPNYRGTRPRRPDRIVYETGVSSAEALARADRGEVDYVPYDYDQQGPLAVGGPRDRAFGARSAAARRGDQRYYANPASGLDAIALNASRPLFRDAAMRRAVNLAIDRTALAAVWAELPTDRYVPPSILPPGRARYPLSGPDVAGARRLAAGRRGTATLYFCGEAPNRRVAEIVRENLRPIGIRVRIKESLACLRGPDPARDVADMALTSPGSIVPDAEGFLALVAGSDDKFGGNLIPREWWNDTEFARKLASADALPADQRNAAFARLQEEALADDVPLATFASFVRPEYVTPRVGCRIAQGAYQFLDLGAACVRAGG